MIEAALAKHLDATIPELTFDESGASGNVFIDTMPSGPDVAVMVHGTGGWPQMSKEPDDLPTVQMLVRGPQHDPRPPKRLAKAIYDRLACLDGVTLDPGGPDEVHVVGCTPIQSAPVPLGQDENRRHEVSLNFVLHVHHPTPHRP